MHPRSRLDRYGKCKMLLLKRLFSRSASGVLNKSIWPLVSWDFGFILNKNLQEINIYFTHFLQLLPIFSPAYCF